MYNTSSKQSLSTASTYMVLKVQDKAGLGLRFDLDILFVNPFISPQNQCQIFTYFSPNILTVALCLFPLGDVPLLHIQHTVIPIYLLPCTYHNSRLPMRT
jgi:hypothetical protein